MGVFCKSCDSQKNDNFGENEEFTQNIIERISLPKKDLNNNQETSIIKFEHDEETIGDEDTKKISHSVNKKKVQNNTQSKVLKSKTMLFNFESNLKSKTKIVMDKKGLKGKDTTDVKKKDTRSNSLRESKHFLNILNNAIFVNDNKQKNTKPQNEIIKKNSKKEEKIEEKPKNVQNVEKKRRFIRKNRKTTTLMENANVVKQLFDIQMSIPVSQQILIKKQKGSPADKYIKGRMLGSGSFGTVYEAKNNLFNNIVAMKIIHKKVNQNNLMIKNEIDILKKLSHPNIVKIYEFYESQNFFYLVNEYCREGELYNYINKSVLNEQQLSIIFYQVFSGLYYLHENTILHRDLKPENILISKKEIDPKTNEEYFWIQIIDFGTAKIFEQDKNEKSIVGSAYYIAPEVLNQDYNEKCDTWSVGVILYMFLVGRAPFDGANNEEIIYSIRTKNYDENNEKLLSHSPEVRDLVKNLLQKDIKKRFSAKEALNHQWFKKFNGRKLFGLFSKDEILPFINNIFNYTFHSKIQQLVIAFLVHNLPMNDTNINILKIYRYFNKSGDCKLTKDELINGLIEYKDKNEVEQNVDNLFKLLDGDNNGYIEFEEFLRACINKKELLTEEHLKYAFNFLDKENKGILTAKEINLAFCEQENKLFEIAISKDINDFDEDGDGNINFEEFKKLMANTMD